MLKATLDYNKYEKHFVICVRDVLLQGTESIQSYTRGKELIGGFCENFENVEERKCRSARKKSGPGIHELTCQFLAVSFSLIGLAFSPLPCSYCPNPKSTLFPVQLLRKATVLSVASLKIPTRKNHTCPM